MKFSNEQIRDITKACKTFSVRYLYVFGSYASGDFTDKSDVDFLVEFNRDGYEGAFDQYLDLKAELENILKRNVDLVCLRSVRNQVFKREAEATKEIVYAA